jgi:hypothetical protein
MVEYSLAKARVEGSNPFFRFTHKKTIFHPSEKKQKLRVLEKRGTFSHIRPCMRS